MNPAPGGAALVGFSRACRLVKRKQASWIDNGTAIVIINQEAKIAEWQSQRYYDHEVGFGQVATVKQMRGLPMVNPMAMLKLQTKRSKPIDCSGKHYVGYGPDDFRSKEEIANEG